MVSSLITLFKKESWVLLFVCLFIDVAHVMCSTTRIQASRGRVLHHVTSWPTLIGCRPVISSVKGAEPDWTR